jgi:VWFA-related protein
MPLRTGTTTKVLFSLGTAVAAGALLQAGAAQPGGSGAYSESTEVTAVQVPVQVVRGGVPVRGLTAADFEVYDGRRKQKLTGFEVLDLAMRQGGASLASIPPSLRRHFLLLFDLSFSEPRSIVRARRMVADMLPALHPSDLVAVATYSSANGPRLVVGFTSDRRQVLKAIDHLGLPQLVDRNADPLQLVAADEFNSARAQQAQVAVQTGSAKPSQLAEAAYVELIQNLARVTDTANREQQQAVVSALTRSFTDLAGLMARVHGRKQVIYLSEGFDTSLLQGSESQQEQEQMSDLAARGEAYNVDSEKRFGATRQANSLARMLEQFRRADCVIQAVDVGGLRGHQIGGTGEAPARRSGEGSLFVMAHDTGGELYRNFNDLGSAMDQLLARTSVTYVLTFQPENLGQDGAWHPLRVELKNAAAGSGGAPGQRVQVSFRPGYHAPKPYRQLSAGERQLAAAEAVMGGGDGGTLGVSMLAAPFRAAAGAPGPPGPAVAGTAARAYVPVVVEVDGASLLNGTPGNVLALEVFAYAIDSAGAIQDYLSQALRFELAKVIPLLDRTGLKFYGHLDLPPGDYNVRVLVRNAGSGDFGLRNQPLQVSGAGHAEPLLLPPLFPEVPARWLMVHEATRGGHGGEGARQAEVPYPFVVRDRVYVPALRPALAPAQQVALALIGFDLPPGELKVEARIVAAGGTDLGTGELQLDGREPPDAAGAERLTASFRPPRGLQPGEYQLVLVLTDARGVAHHSSARFVVAPGNGRGGPGARG